MSPSKWFTGTSDVSEVPAAPAVVALGGGHGLAASLSALRRVTTSLTAVVTVADDGGSSGRLRRDLGVLPPGDLRMALAALCEDDEWGRTWSRVVQHRFTGPGDLSGHAVGNLLIVALWELAADDPVNGLDWVGRLLKASGRVLPMSTVPLDIRATVAALPEDETGTEPVEDRATKEVHGQAAIATAEGQILAVSLIPDEPPACAEAVAAVDAADWVVLGPGSWFTSVLPHLLVPDLADALRRTRAQRAVVINLEPQPGETTGFRPESHLEVLRKQDPDLRVDVVVADAAGATDRESLDRAAAALGAVVVYGDLRAGSDLPRHDPDALAAAFQQIMAGSSSTEN
jgi:uncharacterized cofD-like protein